LDSSAAATQPGPERRVARVFAPASFALALVGVFGTVAVASQAHVLFADRLRMAGAVAAGLAALAGALFAALLGGAAAVVGRRLAFYEISTAAILFRSAGGDPSLGVLGFLAWISWLAVAFTIDSWGTPMPSLRWPYSFHYAGAALGLIAMTGRHAQSALRRHLAPG